MARGGAVTVRFKAKAGRQQIESTAISQVVNGPGVRRDLRRRAERVRAAMVRKVGVKSGRLRATIRVVDRGQRGLGRANVQVLAGRPGLTPYLGYHEYGTVPHEIRPRGPGYPLRFFWEKVGHEVTFMKVNHPGTRANRFIRDSTRYWRP